MMTSESLNLEIWDRLFQGKSLSGLPIPVKDGRLFLGGLAMPDPAIVQEYRSRIQSQNETRTVNVRDIQPNAIFQGVTWKDLDFSGSKLKSIRFFGCELHNCWFEKCQLQDFRLWSTKIIGSSFKGANLRNSALGGLQDGRRNLYSGVDFSKADLRGAAFTSAEFIRCVFKNTKLDRVDFGGSTFIECVFEGELNEVIFNRRAFQAESLPPNEMKRVDFSRAQLKTVEFRELDLDEVSFPADENHIVVDNYAQTLDRLLQVLGTRTDMGSKGLLGYFSVARRWVGSKQHRGIFHKGELLKIGGSDVLNLVLETIGSNLK